MPNLTTSAFESELAYRLCVAKSTLMDVDIYFGILFYYYVCLYTTFLLSLRVGWLMVLNFFKEDYLNIFKCVSFWLQGCCSQWEGLAPVNLLNTPM